MDAVRAPYIYPSWLHSCLFDRDPLRETVCLANIKHAPNRVVPYQHCCGRADFHGFPCQVLVGFSLPCPWVKPQVSRRCWYDCSLRNLEDMSSQPVLKRCQRSALREFAGMIDTSRASMKRITGRESVCVFVWESKQDILLWKNNVSDV